MTSLKCFAKTTTENFPSIPASCATRYVFNLQQCTHHMHWETESSINLEGRQVDCFVINTLRPRRNRRHFADDIFKCIFLKFIPKGPINNIPTLVQIMAWRRPGDKPLSEPMMIISLTHICVARPQWVKGVKTYTFESTMRSHEYHDVLNHRQMDWLFHSLVRLRTKIYRPAILATGHLWISITKDQ